MDVLLLTINNKGNEQERVAGRRPLRGRKGAGEGEVDHGQATRWLARKGRGEKRERMVREGREGGASVGISVRKCTLLYEGCGGREGGKMKEGKDLLMAETSVYQWDRRGGEG